MRSNNVLGVIFTNVNDEHLPELTRLRSIAAVPFGARYRVIDFTLSAFVNAGINKVGIITKQNYRSLMDHLGSGKEWDLDRKQGGLFVLPPFANKDATEVFKGRIDALASVGTFFRRSKEEYVVLCDADVVMNPDIAAIVDNHIENGADVTLAYKKEYSETEGAFLTLSDDGKRVVSVDPHTKATGLHSVDIAVLRRELLLELINEASKNGYTDFNRDILAKQIDTLKINGYEVTDFVSSLSDTKKYFDANMSLLKKENFDSLFNKLRPVYTKTKDGMPTRYGLNSIVSNSLLGDGCIIKGTVKNSIIFRGVTVEEGAVVENSIVMQASRIGKNASVKYAIIEKNAEICDGKSLIGTDSEIAFISKGEKI